MATKEDRTLGSGISFPQWMRTKSHQKFELDPNAFSPPELEDSFILYYRHPKKETKANESTVIKANLPENITVSAVKKHQDFSHHPVPCQKYLQNGLDISPKAQTTAEMKTKSSGTDDGFKGEAARCGSSIIKVATQMVSGRASGGGRSDCGGGGEEEAATPPPASYQRQRRGSRSLPASPLTSPGNSPKAGRKMNKYFTGAFTDVDKSKGSWLLSNLLARREISQSVGQIKEELPEELGKAASTASVDDFPGKRPVVYKAKPSELREMNFWSPTSM
ncbi:unnamed protein product [Phyllotreta striolata]|uniref:Uncharacterized protein n=1 Tax=Phyllotreta striolata TaxID=444603 RepID=A0A9N9TLE6_PHYSR|nr:unnamed protein product [Phyllotreta striolata]